MGGQILREKQSKAIKDWFAVTQRTLVTERQVRAACFCQCPSLPLELFLRTTCRAGMQHCDEGSVRHHKWI